MGSVQGVIRTWKDVPVATDGREGSLYPSRNQKGRFQKSRS